MYQLLQGKLFCMRRTKQRDTDMQWSQHLVKHSKVLTKQTADMQHCSRHSGHSGYLEVMAVSKVGVSA